MKEVYGRRRSKFRAWGYDLGHDFFCFFAEPKFVFFLLGGHEWMLSPLTVMRRDTFRLPVAGMVVVRGSALLMNTESTGLTAAQGSTGSCRHS